tara:strand:- start:954 stop:1862 length:909 start_codon:yes stop_codon:yes gene_type:complete
LKIPNKKLSFIGLGQMGFPMAVNLLKANYLINAYDINKNLRKKFEKLGGEVSSNLEACTKDAKFIVTMLPNGDIVKKTILSYLKIKKLLDYEVIVIDMSSSDPIGTIALAKKLIKSKIKIIDAPVSGGVKKAISGNLSIMVSGNDKIIFKKVEPILKCLGANIILTGSLGSAHAMKAINNYVSAMGLVAASEAIILGEKFGIDPNTINKILNVSSGKNNSTENKISQFVLTEKFSSGFSLSLMSKDIMIANNLAKKLNIQPIGIEFSAKTWKAASSYFKKNTDHTKIFKYLREISTQKKLKK